MGEDSFNLASKAFEVHDRAQRLYNVAQTKIDKIKGGCTEEESGSYYPVGELAMIIKPVNSIFSLDLHEMNEAGNLESELGIDSKKGDLGFSLRALLTSFDRLISLNTNKNLLDNLHNFYTKALGFGRKELGDNKTMLGSSIRDLCTRFSRFFKKVTTELKSSLEKQTINRMFINFIKHGRLNNKERRKGSGLRNQQELVKALGLPMTAYRAA